MPTPRRPRSESFEEHVTATLEAQDRMLESLSEKLEKPVLNGGFDRLVEKVEKIDQVTEQLSTGQERLRESQEGTSKKVGEMLTVVMDPETGLYHKVKSNSKWIDTVSTGMKWFGGVLIVGTLSGIGKLLYDFFSGHIHFTP